MPMPIRLFALAALAAGGALVALPAAAREPGKESRTADLADKLSDPQAQMAASLALAALVQTILDMDISSYARAVAAAGGGDAVRDLPPDAKLGDLVGPQAEHMPGTVARKVPKAMGSAAEMARSVDEIVPQLKETARRLKRSLPDY